MICNRPQTWFAQSLAVLALGLSTAHAATPSEGSVSPASPELVFESGPHLISNPAYPDTGACLNPALVCDDFALAVEVPADVPASQSVRLTVRTEAPLGEDYDIYLLDDGGQEINSSASGGTPEEMVLLLQAGTQNYTVRIIPWLVTGTVATTKITLEFIETQTGGDESGPQAGLGDGKLPLNPEAPRYSVYVSPPEEGNDAGEPTVGYNPLTKRAMFISYVNALRVTFPENLDEALPESCDANWENKSGLITTLNSLDPIMTTDQDTGRTFNSQLSGANSLFEFSDDDGESWTPGQIGVPNGGADHQGVVAGPYPADFPIGGLLYPNAVYYCSQSVASAFCSRSDDGGQTFGPGYPFKNTDCSAGGLHGHPKVAPDGTLYIPDSSQCVLPLGETAEKVVTFVSEDAGMTYAARPIPTSEGGAGSDPSIGIATDGTAYMCYENADGTTRVAVSKDKGLSWANDQDIGAAAGLVATRFPAMIAGDPDRAACAFLGTTTEGPDLELGFTGVWYPYIATTYDGGKTWDLVNLSPDDPVQGFGGVGTSGTNRNLLDFNDLELDDMGRPLFAYADGCIGGCVIDPSQNSFAAKATLARQSGGRSLYAKYDDQFRSGPQPPKAACPLARHSQRTVNQTVIGWNAPDNGGLEISNYQVYRSEQPTGPFVLIGNSSKTRFIDSTADPAVTTYYYKVVAENEAGTSPQSNVLSLPLSTQKEVDTCSLPGAMIIQDPAGDSPVSDYDVLSFSVAEPADFADHFVFTLKLAGFTASEPPPSSFYPVLFPLLNNLYLAFDVTLGAPRFVHGQFVELPQGLLQFNEAGSLDSRSSYGADGTVVMIVPKVLFGELEAGDVIAGFDIRSRMGASAAPSRDTAGPADYIVRGHENCRSRRNALVIAELSSSRNEGRAPTTVEFTISGQASDGSRLSSWSLDFGDGESVEKQPFNSTGIARISHSYLSEGVYRAKATVRDSQGRSSANLAEQTIEIGVAERSLSALRGGSLGWLLIALLLPLRLRRSHQR